MKKKDIWYPKDKFSSIKYIDIQSFDFFDGMYRVLVKDKKKDEFRRADIYEAQLYGCFTKKPPKRIQKLPLP